MQAHTAGYCSKLYLHVWDQFHQFPYHLLHSCWRIYVMSAIDKNLVMMEHTQQWINHHEAINHHSQAYLDGYFDDAYPSKPATIIMIATTTTTIFLLLQNGTSNFMKVKIIDHQDLSVAEKQINEFLKKVEVKELIDVKFGTRFKNDTEGHTFVIIYEENMAAGVEDPQIYE